MEERVQKYLDRYSGTDLLKKHKLSDRGTWHVQGEDPNCDFGGSHSNPSLGFYEGKLSDVLELAVDLPGFFTWGGGGVISPITVVRVAENTLKKRKELKQRISELESTLANVKHELGSLE